MSFEKLPELPEMLFPQSARYRERAVALSYQAHRDTRSVTDSAYSDESYWHKVDFYMPEDKSLTGLPVMCFMHGRYNLRGRLGGGVIVQVNPFHEIILVSTN